MGVSAIGRNIRVAPRKARLVINMIRGKSVTEALALLKFTNQKAAPIITKVIRSAMANAEHNHNLNSENMVVKVARVDDGPFVIGRPLRRYIFCARGRASVVRQRASHIIVELEEK